MNPLNLFKRNIVWNTAIYVERSDFVLSQQLSKPTFVLSARKAFRRSSEPYIIADPFLFEREGRLYLFVEIEPSSGRGRIAAFSTSDLKEFRYLGEVLCEPHHLSYPFVFEHEGRQFLIPESFDAEEICLYEFEKFPFKPIRRRTLLRGRYVDTSVLMHDGRWYLFTTSSRGLELYHTEDLMSGRIIAHPMNPITTDVRYSRCGGGAFFWAGGLYRLAQDCLGGYGNNLHLFEVSELSEERYSERLVKTNLLLQDSDWNSLGGHHMSVRRFGDSVAIAVDGKQHDYYVNKLRGLIRRVTGI